MRRRGRDWLGCSRRRGRVIGKGVLEHFVPMLYEHDFGSDKGVEGVASFRD